MVKTENTEENEAVQIVKNCDGNEGIDVTSAEIGTVIIKQEIPEEAYSEENYISQQQYQFCFDQLQSFKQETYDSNTIEITLNQEYMIKDEGQSEPLDEPSSSHIVTKQNKRKKERLKLSNGKQSTQPKQRKKNNKKSDKTEKNNSDRKTKKTKITQKNEKKKEQKSKVQKETKELIECKECGKRFRSQSSYQTHTFVHTGIYPFPCEDCGKRFKRAILLKDHQKVHTGYRPHICPLCGKSFTVNGSLKVHLLTHTGEKPHMCSECGKCFVTTSDLHKHKNSHSDVRPFSCTKCDKSFKRKTTLKHHIELNHEGLPPSAPCHVCHICGKRFRSSASALRRHMISHTKPEDREQHLCNICGRSYSIRSYLTSHMKSHSGNYHLIVQKRNETRRKLREKRRQEQSKPPAKHIVPFEELSEEAAKKRIKWRLKAQRRRERERQKKLLIASALEVTKEQPIVMEQINSDTTGPDHCPDDISLNVVELNEPHVDFMTSGNASN